MTPFFETTAPFLLFDYFRVPYAVTDDSNGALHRCVTRSGPGRSLFWPRAVPSSDRRPPFRLRDIVLHSAVVEDAAAESWLASSGMTWTREEPIETVEGRPVAHVWRSDRGDLFVPFDPGDVIRTFWSEAYENSSRRALKGMALRCYYALRPLLPRRAQIAARRALAGVQARRKFPRWPLETSLHDFYDLLFEYLSALAGSAIPVIAPWPRGHSWAFVLTHDVETEAGCKEVAPIARLERELGFRSSWNFVPKRYTVESSLLEALDRDGFEIGVHGLYHDGRDLESRAMLTSRLPEIEQHAERWKAVGFRSPATHRSWELMPLLPFLYDSSYPDTDPFEPRAGGCCSLLPFAIGDQLVELPITLPQDHTLFVILRRDANSTWSEKTAAIRDRSGMSLLITHPDYLTTPDRVAAYGEYLAEFRDDDTAWRALPREVAEWWARRSASALELEGDEWRVVGPAADDATVEWKGAARSADAPTLTVAGGAN